MTKCNDALCLTRSETLSKVAAGVGESQNETQIYMFTVNFGETNIAAQMASRGLRTEFEANLLAARNFASDLYTDNLPPFAKQHEDSPGLTQIEAIAAHIRNTFKHLVVLGTGGSSLGAQAAMRIAAYLPENVGGPKVHIHTPDSICPFEMDRLLAQLPANDTHVLTVSKSGTTAETLSQLLIFRAWFEGQDILRPLSDHFTFITEPGDRALRRYGEDLGSTILDHPTDVGGRFSVLTNVGMLPVAVSGLSVDAFRAGAAHAVMQFASNAESAAPTVGAALIHTLANHAGVSQVLLMPYMEALREFTRWHGQLWAESIGKDGLGTTPIRAVGPVDQHSQLQLYLDGPNDKFCTFITVPSYGKGPQVNASAARAFGLDYMAGRTIGDTVTCQSRATQKALRARGRITREFVIEDMNERALGALFVSFMLETVIMAHLMGVNAYDQPAVEDGKIITRQYLAALAEKD